MKSLWIAFGAVVVLMLILGGCYFSGRNALIAQDENVNEHWSQIEVQLQRRADLIPNLVSSVKGYAKHEEKISRSWHPPARTCFLQRGRRRKPRPERN